jgi:hypothetical protein
MPLALLLAAFLLISGVGYVSAKAFLTQPQALSLAFPAGGVQRKTVFLKPEQVAQIEALAHAKMDTRIVSFYVSRGPSGVQGVAFFDRRVVRTLPIVYMAVLRPSGAVERVEVMDFEEPDDYLPSAKWLALFRGKPLSDDLAVGRVIPHITGASLTSQAMNDGLRLIMATYQIAVKGTL